MGIVGCLICVGGVQGVKEGWYLRGTAGFREVLGHRVQLRVEEVRFVHVLKHAGNLKVEKRNYYFEYFENVLNHSYKEDWIIFLLSFSAVVKPY